MTAYTSLARKLPVMPDLEAFNAIDPGHELGLFYNTEACT